jgi:hypothetical protein
MNPYNIDKILLFVFSMSIFTAVQYLTNLVIVAGELQKSSSAIATASNEGCYKWAISMNNILPLLLLLNFCASTSVQ